MYIYMLRNSLNDKAYIGQTIKEPNERFARHLRYSRREADRQRMPIAAAIHKYGWDNFTKHVLEVCESSEQLNTAEIRWINHYKSIAPFGYNLRPGGDGRGAMHELTKQKLANAATGRLHSDDVKRKISESCAGKSKSSSHNSNTARAMQGSKNSKLTWEKVIAIRERYKNGETQKTLATEYGVSSQNVWLIVNNRAWVV